MKATEMSTDFRVLEAAKSGWVQWMKAAETGRSQNSSSVGTVFGTVSLNYILQTTRVTS